jgi:hypothetical protein
MKLSFFLFGLLLLVACSSPLINKDNKEKETGQLGTADDSLIIKKKILVADAIDSLILPQIKETYRKFGITLRDSPTKKWETFEKGTTVNTCRLYRDSAKIFPSKPKCDSMIHWGNMSLRTIEKIEYHVAATPKNARLEARKGYYILCGILVAPDTLQEIVYHPGTYVIAVSDNRRIRVWHEREKPINFESIAYFTNYHDFLTELLKRMEIMGEINFPDALSGKEKKPQITIIVK